MPVELSKPREKPLPRPVCDQRFDESDDGVAMPFCSTRCKRIDAARWPDERYGIPIEQSREDDFPEEEGQDARHDHTTSTGGTAPALAHCLAVRDML